jgi:hypothetical protein
MASGNSFLNNAMTMLQIHATAISAQIASYHEFLLRYSKTAKVVYGFVEGKDDPCFYRGFIEHLLPDNWEVELWPAGSRDQVYRVHADIDWRHFPKNRICFFVDRDLSSLIPEALATDSNIYMTDSYSIENDLVKKGTCKRVLSEVCSLGTLDHGELDTVCDLFESELEKFLAAMIPIMAWILHWRRKGERAALSDILMKDLFSFSSGTLQMNPTPKGKATPVHYIHEQCNVVHDAKVDIAPVEAEFRKGGAYRRFTRGKYVFWFLIEFCCYVRGSVKTHFKSCTRVPPMNVSFAAANGMTIIGNRARIPKSLKSFLMANYCEYIEAKAT